MWTQALSRWTFPNLDLRRPLRFIPMLLAALFLAGVGLSRLAGAGPVEPTPAPGGTTRADDAGLSARIVDGILSNSGAAAVVASAPMIGFVIDNTASMPQSLPGIRMGINALMDCVPTFQGTIPPQFLFMTLNDPVISDPLITDSPYQLKSWVMGIQTSGGGTCPEPAMAALLRAIGGALPNAAIFLFTDASSSDCDKSLLVVSAAREKNIKIFTIVTGSCYSSAGPQVGAAPPPANPDRGRHSPSGGDADVAPAGAQILSSSACSNAFFDVSFLTGGMRIDATPTDVNATVDAGKSFLDASVSFVAAIDGLLAPGVNSRSFPIDSTVQRVDFIVRMNLKQSIVIRNPGGTAISLSGPGVYSSSFDTGQVTSIDNPTPGTWTVDMSGGGLFNIDVLVKSPIALTEFTFVTISGPIGDRAYHPIHQIPRSSGTLNAILGFTGVTVPTGTRLVNDAGNLVTGYSIAASSNLGAGERLATVSNVSEPYRAEISGMDVNGYAYQRVSPMFTRPTDLHLSASGVPAQMNANGEYTFHVTVQNLGPTRTFDFVGDATLRMDYVNVTPSSATIAGGGARTLTVWVGVPLDNMVTAITDFVVSARESNGAGNALVIPILVIENLPPDCSGAYTYGIDTSYMTNELEPVLFGGIYDPEGQPVSVQLTEVYQDEEVEYNTGADANRTCPDADFSGGQNLLRNESAHSGNGRVYTGMYVASDPQGKQCIGPFSYCIPRHNGRGTTCTDDGQLYNSTAACTRFNFGDVVSPALVEPSLVVTSASPARMNLQIVGVPAGDLTIRVFDISGHLVEQVWQGVAAEGGLDLNWDTSRLGSGVYFVRAEAGGKSLVRKVLIAR